MLFRLPGAAIMALLALTVSAWAGVTSGQVTALDRDRHLVTLDDGSVYYVPNRVYLSDFKPRRRVTIWYREENGVREVWRHEVKGSPDE